MAAVDPGVPGEKWILRSARVWAVITGVIGIVIPLFGYNPADVVPIVDQVGSQGFAAASMVLALVHFVRASWEKLRLIPRGPSELATASVFAVFALSIVWGCAHYDRLAVLGNARIYQDRPTIQIDECDAMEETAGALRDGPNLAGYVLGRAGELGALSQAFDLHSDQCRELLAREMAPDQQAEAREIFSDSWAAAAEAVQ